MGANFGINSSEQFSVSKWRNLTPSNIFLQQSAWHLYVSARGLWLLPQKFHYTSYCVKKPVGLILVHQLSNKGVVATISAA